MAYRRIYPENIKKYLILSGISIPLIFGIFYYLAIMGDITITGYTNDTICAGTIEEPCYAYINFTANKDIYIYPTNDTTWSFNISKQMKQIIMQRQWGNSWRTIDLSKTYSKTTKYAVKFSNGQNYSLRFIGYKNNPFETIKWGFSNIDPVWLGIGEYHHVSIEGRVYTPICLTECHLPINFTLYNNLVIQKSDFTKVIKNQVGNFEITDWGFDYLVNETYNITIPNCTSECNPYDVWNETNQTYGIISNCTYPCNSYQIEKWRYVWKPVPNTINIKANKPYIIDLWVKKKPSLGFSAIDIVPKIKNYELSSLAWWDTNWDYYKNVTVTHGTRTVLNYALTYWLNHGGNANYGNNCSDIRIVNDVGIELAFGMRNCNSTDVQLVNKWNITGGANIVYSVYYGNTTVTFANTTWDNIAYTTFSLEDDDNTTIADKFNWTVMDTDPGPKIYTETANKFIRFTSGTGDYGAVIHNETNSTIIYGQVRGTAGSRTGGCMGFMDKNKRAFHGCINIAQAPAVAIIIQSRVVGSGDDISSDWGVCSNLTANQWETTKLTYDGTNLNFTVNNCSILWNPTTDPYGDFIAGFFPVYDYYEPTVGATEYDSLKSIWFLIPEATYSLGAEQSQEAPISSTNITIYLNSTQTNQTLTYGQISNITATVNVTSLNIELYKNGTLINNGTNRVENITNINWFEGAKVYNITARYVGNASFSASSRTFYITVNKVPVGITLYKNGSAWTTDYTTIYPEVTTINATINVTGLSVTLLRNSTPVSNPETKLLGVEVYNYTGNYTGNQNYSNAVTERNLIITKANNPTDLFLRNSTAEFKNQNMTIMYRTQVNATSNCLIGNCYMYRNATNITITENNTLMTLGAGNWNYTVFTSGNANYSANLTNYWLTVNKYNIPQWHWQLKINDTGPPTDGNLTLTHPDEANVTAAWQFFATDSYNLALFRNGTVISNSSQDNFCLLYGYECVRNKTWLTPGIYNFTAHKPETANYTSFTTDRWVTVNPAVPVPHLFLNGSENNKSYIYGNIVNVSGSVEENNVPFILYRNGTIVMNESSQNMKYAWRMWDKDNNTYATMSGQPTDLTIYNQILRFNSILYTNISVNYSSDTISCTGFYYYYQIWNYSSNSWYNWIEGITGSSGQRWNTTNMTPEFISDAESRLNISLIVAACSNNVDLLTWETFGIIQSDIEKLPVGKWNYTMLTNLDLDANTFINSNYSSVTTTYWVEINKTVGSYLALNNTEANKTYAYGQISNTTGWNILNSAHNLYRNGTLIYYYLNDLIFGSDNSTQNNKWLVNFTKNAANATQNKQTGNYFSGADGFLCIMDNGMESHQWTESTIILQNQTYLKVNYTDNYESRWMTVETQSNYSAIHVRYHIDCGTDTICRIHPYFGVVPVSNEVTYFYTNATGVMSGNTTAVPENFITTGLSLTGFNNTFMGFNISNTDAIIMMNLTNNTPTCFDAPKLVYDDYAGSGCPNLVGFAIGSSACGVQDIEFDVIIRNATNDWGNLKEIGYNNLINDNKDILKLATGMWNYTYYIDANENYTTLVTYWANVTKIPVDVKLYVNGSQANYSQSYGDPTNATATINVTDIKVYLQRNGTDVANGFSIATSNLVLPAGMWNFTAFSNESSNHTIDIETWWVLVNQSATNITLYLNGSQTNMSATIHDRINITTVVNISVTVYLNLNATGYGINFTSGTGKVTNITGTLVNTTNIYNVTGIFYGNANYSSSFKTLWLTIRNITIDVDLPRLTHYEVNYSSCMDFSPPAKCYQNGTFNLVNQTTFGNYYPALEAYYSFGEYSKNISGNNKVTKDASFNQYDGVIAGANYTVLGYNNTEGLELNGSGNYVNLGQPLLENLTAGTVELWFKWKGTKDEWLISKYAATTSKFYCELNNTLLNIKCFLGNITNNATVNSSTVTKNSWYHLVFAWNTSGIYMYLNGTFIIKNATYVSGYNQSSQPTSLGSSGVGYWYNGTIDNVRIWNTVFNQDNVTTYFNLEKIYYARPIFKITNLGDASGNITVALNGTISSCHMIWATNMSSNVYKNNLSLALNLTGTTTQIIYHNLPTGQNCQVWMWEEYRNCTAGTTFNESIVVGIE